MSAYMIIYIHEYIHTYSDKLVANTCVVSLL